MHNTYAPPKRSLEDALQAFMQTQAQINQNTMQALQDLKNSVDRIEAQLNAEEKEEFSAQPHMNNEEVQEDNMIEPLIKDVVTPLLPPDPLEARLNPSEDIKKNEKIGEISSLLILAP